MSVTEINETPAPKKKRKVAKKKAAHAKPKPADGIFAGITVKDCCNSCNANGCVISGKSYCAHPRKGGLHAAEQQNDGAMQRRRDAEKVLGKQKLVVNE